MRKAPDGGSGASSRIPRHGGPGNSHAAVGILSADAVTSWLPTRCRLSSAGRSIFAYSTWSTHALDRYHGLAVGVTHPRVGIRYLFQPDVSDRRRSDAPGDYGIRNSLE